MSMIEAEALRTLDGTVTVAVRDLMAGTQALTALADQTDSAKGSALVGHRGRTLRAKLDDVVSIMDFGAAGTGAVDDTAALVAAHAALPITGGTILLPGGRTFRLETPVTLTKPVRLQGAGKGSTRLVRTTSANSTFFTVNSPDCSMYGIRMTGVGSATATAGTYGVSLSAAATGFVAADVLAVDIASGFNLAAAGFRLTGVEVRDYKASTGVGFNIASGTAGGSALLNTYTNCSDGAEPLAGILVQSIDGLTLSGCRSKDCGLGLEIAPPAGNAVKNVDIIGGNLGTGNQGGIRLRNSGSLGRIERIKALGVTCTGSANGAGFGIVANSIIHQVQVVSCDLYTNLNGLYVDNSVTLFSADFLNNNIGGNTSADIAFGTNVANWRLIGNTTGQGPGLTPLAPVSLYISPGCSRFTVVANTFHIALTDASYPAVGAVIESNSGPWGASAIVFDAAAIAAGAGFTGSMPCAGARPGDFPRISFSVSLQGLSLTCWVESNDVIGFRLQNGTGASIDLPSATVRARNSRCNMT